MGKYCQKNRSLNVIVQKHTFSGMERWRFSSLWGCWVMGGNWKILLRNERKGMLYLPPLRAVIQAISLGRYEVAQQKQSQAGWSFPQRANVKPSHLGNVELHILSALLSLSIG